MPRFRNTSGQDLFVVAVQKLVEDDGVFEVSDDDAPGFECQPTNFTGVGGPPSKRKESE